MQGIKQLIKKKYTLWFFTALVALVVWGGVFGYFFFRSQEYVPVNSAKLNRKQIADAQQLLTASPDGNYKYLYYLISDEYNQLSRYAYVKRMNSSDYGRATLYLSYTKPQIQEILSYFNYTEAEADERLATLTYCQERLQYVINYPNYIALVRHNIRSVSDMDIFNSATRKNALKAEQMFYGHDNIQISAEPDLGVSALLSYRFGDAFALVLVFLCGLFYCMRFRAGASRTVLTKSGLFVFGAAVAFGLLALYAGEAYVCNRFFTLGDLNRTIQSVSAYQSCPYLISVGFLLAARILFKLAAGLALYYFFISVFFCRRPLITGAAALIILFAELLPNPPGMAVSLYQMLHPEALLTRYEHFFLFRELLNPALALTLFSFALPACSILLAARQVSAALLTEKAKAEQTYYDEINRTYTEVRLIRHDINNHLTAVALLMDEGRIGEARDYLGKITERLGELTPPVKTGSTVLDAVLLGKANAAEERGVTIQMEFLTDFSAGGISDFDLCSVFGNLLDNAIDACGRLPDTDRRVLLRVKKQMDMICVYCENRYAAIRQENGSFVSLKADKGAHGLGLRQVRRIAEKHGGMLHIHAENGIFSISVLFHTDEESFAGDDT